MCVGGGGGGSSAPQQGQRDAPEVESAAVNANRDSLKTDTKDSLKTDTSGLPNRPTKEYLGWQKAAKYSGGWKNPDGSIGGNQSSKRY